jgi:hypothetical protein
MPGPVLTATATLLCAHGGQAHSVTPESRVRAGGAPVLVTGVPVLIGGCTSQPPPIGIGTCISATFLTAATRVRAGGRPVVLQDSATTCTPTGTPLTAVPAQLLVRGV